MSISEGQGKIFEQEQFDGVLRAQYSPDTKSHLTRFMLIAPDKAYVASSKKDNKQTKFYLTKVLPLAE